jgi:Ca2+-binding RTX toxin-like protein
MMIEVMESRRLMSASLSAAGVLTVVGKDSNDPVSYDDIDIYVSGSELRVREDTLSTPAVVSRFQLAKVKSIVVNLRAGDDDLTLDANVFLPSTIDSGVGGGGGGDNIQGGSGPDVINVRNPFTSAVGGNGNDTLTNFAGASTLNGQGGNDSLINKFPGTSESKFIGGTGTDSINYSSATFGMILRNGQCGQYIAGTTPPVIDGSTLPDTVETMENFYSGSGNDFVYGTAGNNIIRSGAGKDQVRAGAGNDTINGGTGEDALYGEDGNDTFFAKDSTKDFLSGGLGNDTANKDAIDILNSVEGSF